MPLQTLTVFIFSSILNRSLVNQKNSIIKWWKYTSRELLKATLFCQHKKCRLPLHPFRIDQKETFSHTCFYRPLIYLLNFFSNWYIPPGSPRLLSSPLTKRNYSLSTAIAFLNIYSPQQKGGTTLSEHKWSTQYLEGITKLLESTCDETLFTKLKVFNNHC